MVRPNDHKARDVRAFRDRFPELAQRYADHDTEPAVATTIDRRAWLALISDDDVRRQVTRESGDWQTGGAQPLPEHECFPGCAP